MSLGMHHLRARHRMEPFPSPHVARRLFDYLMYAVGVLQPFALVPQVSAIYVDHAKMGVSLLTWGMLTAFNALWGVYGYIHRDRLIMASNILLTSLDIAIVAGVLWY